MITNAGSVLGEGISLQSAGTVVNAGSVAGAVNGIYLLAGGGVTNQSSASISGYTGVFNGLEDALTLLNAGNITGNTTSVNGAGVDLDDGGVITAAMRWRVSYSGQHFWSILDPAISATQGTGRACQ
jgi:hypothetical protein